MSLLHSPDIARSDQVMNEHCTLDFDLLICHHYYQIEFVFNDFFYPRIFKVNHRYKQLCVTKGTMALQQEKWVDGVGMDG